MAAPGGAEPSHAVREASWAKANLGVTKAVADLSQNPFGADAHLVEVHFRMASGRVVIERVELADDPETGRVHVDQEHGCSPVAPIFVERAGHHDLQACAGSAGDQPFASRDDKFV